MSRPHRSWAHSQGAVPHIACCSPHSMALRCTFVICKGCSLVCLDGRVGVNEEYLDLLLPVLPLKTARTVPSVVPFPQANVQLQGQGAGQHAATGKWCVLADSHLS